MLSYTPQDANNKNNHFNANLLSVSSSKLAPLQLKPQQAPTPHHYHHHPPPPPPLTTHTRTTSAFLSSLLLNAYNQNQNQNSKDLIKNSSLLQTASSTYCTNNNNNNNSTANAAFIKSNNTNNNLSQVKISKKKPLHIVQDEQRLTINLMSHPAPAASSTSSFYNFNNNSNNINSKKQAFAASMPSSLIVNNNNKALALQQSSTPIITSNDTNDGALVALNQNAIAVVATTPPVTTKNKLTKKQSSSSSYSRLCLFNRLRTRNKSSEDQENVIANLNTSPIQESPPSSNLKAYDYKAKKLDLVKTLATRSDNVRLKDFILKHLRQLSNEEQQQQQHDSNATRSAKKLIKTGVKTKTNNLRTIISEAGENWTHYYMPIILIGDLNVNKSTKKMIETYESTANLYKNNKTNSEHNENSKNNNKAILYSKSSTTNDAFSHSPIKSNPTQPHSILPLTDFNLPISNEKKKVFNLNIEQSFRPLTMSTVSQTNSNNRIYSSIASSNKENNPYHSEKTTNVNNNIKHISINNTSNKKQSFTESNRTSHDDEDKEMFKSVSTSISYNGAAKGGNGSASSNTGSSEPSDPEQSNNRLMALKNEIDKTMNEINSFKNEVSFRIQSAVESLTQFDYVKFMQNSSNSNGHETLKHNKGYLNNKNNKFPNIDIPTNFNSNNTVTIETGVNTDISMSNAIFKIKYEDDEEEMSDEHLKHTTNENNEFDVDDDDDNDVSIGDLIDEDEEETDNKSFYSNNSQRSKGKF